MLYYYSGGVSKIQAARTSGLGSGGARTRARETFDMYVDGRCPAEEKKARMTRIMSGIAGREMRRNQMGINGTQREHLGSLRCTLCMAMAMMVNLFLFGILHSWAG